MTNSQRETVGEKFEYDEPFRPQFHFTPAAKWMNDPNGMVYYDGEYHLFYQHYPDDSVWGPMHWGHAISTDLVNWTHLSIALYPDELGYIFSGGAVIDWHNSAGFGKEAMVAFYTYHNPESLEQSQGLAYSNDKGRSWTKYTGNPVIPTLAGIRDFRDPKVIWFPTGEDEGHWVMALAAGSAILFYTSPNLTNWEPSGAFGYGWGSTVGVWETPDLFELVVDNGPEKRWVLTIGVGDGAPAGGSGMQYFVGHFDGYTFTSENPKESSLWADYGADFYAAQSWSDAPDGRRLWLGWLNNWRYANQIPTASWRGAMSIPRDVSLTQTAHGIRIRQQPVAELTRLRQSGLIWKDVMLAEDRSFQPEHTDELIEIIAEFALSSDINRLGLELDYGDKQIATIAYSPKVNALTFDRTNSGQDDFNESFATIHAAPLKVKDGRLRLHLFVDRAAIELFAADGTITFAEQIFPSGRQPSLRFFVDGGEASIDQLEIYKLMAATFERVRNNPV